MKCQKCDKQATTHFTELLGGEPVELHFCAEHAQEYLSQMQAETTPESQNIAAALAKHLAQQMVLNKAAEEMAQIDDETCPNCGISYFEFREQSQLGCPYDYEFFSRHLEPLLINVHGELQHMGKTPLRSSRLSAKCTSLIHLRREMQEAAAAENYERASVLRDQIRQIESEAATR